MGRVPVPPVSRMKRPLPSRRLVSKGKKGGAVPFVLIVLACIVACIPFFSIDLKNGATLTSAAITAGIDRVEGGAPRKSSRTTELPKLVPNTPQKGTLGASVAVTTTERNEYHQGKGSIHGVSNPDFQHNTSFTSPSSTLPYLVIHMGPDKTGTTAIQGFLNQHHAILEQDGYDSSFSKGSHHKAHRLSANTILNCFIAPKYIERPCHLRDRMKDSVQEQVDWFHEQAVQPNVVWSQEGFRWANFEENSDWPWFLERIQPHFSHIQIVVVYRRYFDWILSRYNEDYSGSEYSGTALLRWPDDGDDSKEQNKDNKGEGGVVIPTFETYFQQDQTGTCPNPKNRGQSDCQNYFANRIHTYPDGRVEAAHPLLEMIRPILQRRTKFLSIQILNFHAQDEDLLESFFCRSLPLMVKDSSQTEETTNGGGGGGGGGASLACQEARRVVLAKKKAQTQENEVQPQKRHEHKSLRQSDLLKIQYDRIAVEAHRLRILPFNVSRNAAKHHVQLYHEENKKKNNNNKSGTTNMELPWICPSPHELQVLSETSARFETELLALLVVEDAAADTATTTSISSTFTSTFTTAVPHDGAFAQALQQHKFCHVNVTQVLLGDATFCHYLSTVPVNADTNNGGAGAGGGNNGRGGRRGKNRKKNPKNKQ